MVFRDRHDAEYIIDRRLRITDRLHHIVRLFDPSDRYVVLPRNWAEKFAPINPLDGQPWHPTWFRNYLGELTCKRTSGPHSLLGRYVISETDYSEMMKYYRSPEGDAFAAEHGYPKLAYHREREPDKHQLFGCLTRASLELGVRTDTNFSLEGPREIFTHPKMGAYDPKSPFTFTLPDGRRYTPDDHPLVLRRHDPKESKLLLSEDDRHTMGTVKKKRPEDDTRRLHEKFEKIKIVWSERLFEKKYGHKSALCLFKTTNQRHAENVRDYWLKHFGPASFFL